MRVLVHLCCGPCGITVLQRLLDAGHNLTAFFFNPNIHPLSEYLRRREGAGLVAGRLGVPLLMADGMAPDEQRWTSENAPGEEEDGIFAPCGGEAVLPPAVNPVPWLRAVAGREKDRCPFCWRSRLGKCAATAARLGFAGFTTSLLYSRYQNHEAIRALGRELALATGLLFVYEDFRVFWRQGIALSREWGIYRQQYCGCLFSDYARYSRDLARLRDGGH
jgi:predicted adenine nucleotide alpha hydrolase (AANH) superfamily ATPase